MNDREEARTARLLEDLESDLTGQLEHFRALAARNKARAARNRERLMIEREAQKARAVRLRSAGRSGTRICGRLGIGRQTMVRWLREDASFRTAYNAVFDAYRRLDDEAIKLILRDYHPDRATADGQNHTLNGRAQKELGELAGNT